MNELPRHIAVIMDGNGRWAKQRKLPRHAGHKAGVNATRKLVENCGAKGVEALTIFAFSSENWRRPQNEVGLLMKLFVTTLQGEIKKLHKNKVRVRFIGDRSAFSTTLQDQIATAEQITAENTGICLNIAANYGGRWDITEAIKKVAFDIQSGACSLANITPEYVHSKMSLAELPEPDLFIRTGGEQRISNFLLWQLAYTELYFSDYLWPDFDDQELDNALRIYANRQRRFGYTGEQITTKKQDA